MHGGGGGYFGFLQLGKAADLVIFFEYFFLLVLRLSSSTSKNVCCALTPYAFLLFHTILGSYVYKIG